MSFGHWCHVCLCVGKQCILFVFTFLTALTGDCLVVLRIWVNMRTTHSFFPFPVLPCYLYPLDPFGLRVGIFHLPNEFNYLFTLTYFS